VSSSTGLYLFLLNEYTTSLKLDYYTIYFNWKHLIKNLNCCENKAWLPIKNKWWSYCPQWLYFNPLFIESNFRPLFNNELCNHWMEFLKQIYLKQKKSGLKYG